MGSLDVMQTVEDLLFGIGDGVTVIVDKAITPITTLKGSHGFKVLLSFIKSTKAGHS